MRTVKIFSSVKSLRKNRGEYYHAILLGLQDKWCAASVIARSEATWQSRKL
jgi:hypothetical protein